MYKIKTFDWGLATIKTQGYSYHLLPVVMLRYMCMGLLIFKVKFLGFGFELCLALPSKE